MVCKKVLRRINYVSLYYAFYNFYQYFVSKESRFLENQLWMVIVEEFGICEWYNSRHLSCQFRGKLNFSPFKKTENLFSNRIWILIYYKILYPLSV